MSALPCLSRDKGKTWEVIEWDKKTSLPGLAWIMPIRVFFEPTELARLINEDQCLIRWRQEFEYCYGVHWPLRHIVNFISNEDVDASISHRNTAKEGIILFATDFVKMSIYISLGRHLVLQKCGTMHDFPMRQHFVEQLSKKWKSDLGTGERFNAVQSNIYSGPIGGSNEVNTLDHINFHKDGKCKKRGPPIVSGCYSNVESSSKQTTAHPTVAFLVHHQTEDLRVWIPQVSGTGYAFGGKHCHKKYFHGKFLFGDWQPYQYHVSITFSVYERWNLPTIDNALFRDRGFDIRLDWHFVAKSRLWCRKYIEGQVSKAACAIEVQQINADLVRKSNYELVWGAWDEFANVSILQLLQLHPADHGQGIAGKDYALSLLVMDNDIYPNRLSLLLDDSVSILKLQYYTSRKGKPLLLKAWKESILLRVFLSEPFRKKSQLFKDVSSSLLYLPLMFITSLEEDTAGEFVTLYTYLSDTDRNKYFL